MALNETKQHGTFDLPFGFYPLNCDSPKYEMVSHFHSSLEIIKVLSGRFFVTLNGKSFYLNEKEVAIVNCDTVHGGIPQDCTYECLVFDLSFLKNNNKEISYFIDNLILGNILINEKITDMDILSIIDRLFNAVKNHSSPFEIIAYSDLFLYSVISKNLYIQKEKAFSCNMPAIQKLKQSIKYIRENYNNEISLEDIAKVVGLSPKYFCAFFKELTGKTPFKYLIDYRIEQACKMLLNTEKTATEISNDCGFNDLSYFIKTFKALKGVTPYNYKKNSKE